MAMKKLPSDSVGSTMCRPMSSTRSMPARLAPIDSMPKAGSQPSTTENRMMAISDSQNSGVAYSSMAPDTSTLSGQRRRVSYQPGAGRRPAAEPGAAFLVGGAGGQPTQLHARHDGKHEGAAHQQKG